MTARGDPPGRYVRSPTGAVARLQRASMRSSDGERLYRLVFLLAPTWRLRSRGLFTVAELEGMGCRWLRRRPRKLGGLP